jgi:hypothetical protein
VSATVISPDACAVNERTGDGRSVGRCWFDTKPDGRCPRHGDVRAVQNNYKATGRLTDEWDLSPGRLCTRCGCEYVAHPNQMCEELIERDEKE